MRKAAITGFFTGIVISALLIGAIYVRQFLPDTFTANLFYMGLFFFGIVGVIWMSLSYYCRTSVAKWMTLGLSGSISSIIAALLVTIFREPLQFAVYNFRDLSIVLFLVSSCIAAIYYLRYKNRLPEHAHSKNQELIF